MTKGIYYTLNLGEAMQRIKLLKVKDDIFSILKSNWTIIIQDLDFVPQRYNMKTGTLTISSAGPVLYLQHFAEPIMVKCNQFIGYEGVKSVKIVKK